MDNVIIIGTGKIGIDLYIKCKKSKKFKDIFIFNRSKNSEGAKFCIKKKYNYSHLGIEGVKKNYIIQNLYLMRHQLVQILKP